MPFPNSVDALVDGASIIHAAQVLGVQRVVVGPTWYNVMDDRFGAVPDGVTDSAPGINAALTAASNAGGGRVVMPPNGSGNPYILGSRLIVPFNVHLDAGGRNSCWVKLSGSFPSNTEAIRLGDLSGNIGVDCRVSDMHLDCNNVTGSIGIYSERINESSGVARVSINNFMSRGVQIKQPASGGIPQHYSLDELEIATSASTPAAAIAIDLANTSLSTPFRRISRITISNAGGIGTVLTTAMKIDGASGRIEQVHIEDMTTGILIGSVLACFGLTVADVDGLGGVTNLVSIANNGGQRSIFLYDINPAGATNSIVDNINGVTLTRDVAAYAIGANFLMGSDSAVLNKFGRLRLLGDLQRSLQTPTETTLVSGVDATAGEIVKVTLTAARLVGAPLNPAVGQRLTFTLVQGGAGAFAVTWNAVFKKTWSDTGNATGARSSISYTYDGTNWNQDGAQAPYV